MAEEENIRVECYSGSRYGERPTAFEMNGERHLIAAVLREWNTPGGYCYRVITEEEQRFDLIYNPAEDRWSAIPLS